MHKKVMAQAVALVLTGLVASAAVAADTKQQAVPAATAGGAMQVMFYDKVTKQMRAPTADEAAALAKVIEQKRQSEALQPNTSGRPRTEAESLLTLRKVRLSNGITVETVDTPESETNTLVGKLNANGQMVVTHGDSDGHAASTEVAQ